MILTMAKRLLVILTLTLLTATAASADIALIEHKSLKHDSPAKAKAEHARRGAVTKATGSQALIDNAGFKYFINTDITFSTSSSASGAMSEASYTHAVAATTLSGGTVSTTLNDAFDGYNTLCLSLDNTVSSCTTGGGGEGRHTKGTSNFVIYNQNGPATTECTGGVSGVNRQVVFPVQTAGNIQMWRKVYVPDNDSYARWLNYFKNTSGSPQTVTAVIANNLGSDANTTIVTSSNGNATAETTDSWLTTFQNYSGTTSSDPRLGHVFQSPGAAVQLAGISFADGDDNPFWGYTFTLAPGETKILMNFVVGRPSKAAAATKAAELAAVQTNGLACTTVAEQAQIANFVSAAPIIDMPTLNGTGLFVLVAGLALAAMKVLLHRRRAA
jgi:hypothetical protein